MSEELSLKQIQKEWHGTLKSYAIGFTASLILTLTSFLLVITRSLSDHNLMITIAMLAFVQALFQLRFFLHAGQEAKPQWESLVLYFMVLVLLIIVLGSLWIMFDLNERVMPARAMEMMHD